MKKLAVAAVLAAGVAFSSPAAAVDLSFTGTFSDPNQVQLFNFNVASPSTVTLRSLSYAGGTNAAGTTIARGGFDPILTLFDSSGAQIAFNDDGGGLVPADTNGNRYDVFLQQLLGQGSYTVAISAFSNFALGPNLSNGFENDGTFNGRSANWAFDILNVNAATQVGGAVPEPGTWAMMLIGFGAMGLSIRMRRRRESQLAAA